MTIYYVKNGGSDAADGLSDENAWETINKVNISSFNAGDSVLFKKGSTWREQLTVPSSGSSGSPITFGAYGSGNKPKILGSVDKSATGDWASIGTENFLDGTGNKPVSWWLLDEASGTRADGNTTSANNLTASASDPTRVTGPSYTEYSIPYGVQFVSANSQMLSRTDANLSAGFPSKTGVADKSVTAGGWMQAAALNTNDIFLGKVTWVVWGSWGQWKFTVNDDSYSAHDAVSDANFTINTWYFVVGRWTVGGEVALFVNGVKQTTPNTSATMAQDGGPLELGHHDWFGYASGKLAMPFVFDVALTDAQILDIYNGELAGLSSSVWKGTATITKEVGNLIFNNEASVGVRKITKASLASQGDFYWDSGTNYLYSYSASNPGTYYTKIECAQKYTTQAMVYISGKNYITVQDLDVRYSAALGIATQDGETGITVERNNVSYIGGAYSASPPIRLGNAIQFYDATSAVICRYNRIDQIFDQAISLEGWTNGKDKSNFRIYYNIISNCEASFDLGPYGTSVYSDIRFENNTCINANAGWGHSQRSDSPATGHLYFWYTDGTVTTSYIRNNIFYTADKALNIAFGWPVAGITIDYNSYYPDGAAVFSYLETTYNFADYKTASGKDAHSIIIDPKLVSASDFHLQSTSPCINAGVDVSLTQDYSGFPVPYPPGGIPDIGGYEYKPPKSIIIHHYGGMKK